MSVRPQWFVYIEDCRNKSIKTYNIFLYDGFWNDCKKAWEIFGADENTDDLNSFIEFSDLILNSLFYFFWSKVEWEIVMTSVITCKDFKQRKVDVYSQIIANWDAFISYLRNWFEERNN